jgi:outer membrane immunogenic protein
MTSVDERRRVGRADHEWAYRNMTFKSFCGAVALAGGIALSTSASAGSYDWSGIYFGGHIGGAGVDLTAIDEIDGFFTIPPGDTFSFEAESVIGGVQLGYQKQFGAWVLGAEVSGSFLDAGEKIASPFAPAFDTAEMNVESTITVMARLGYAFDRWMVYAKAGYAGASVQLDLFSDDPRIPPPDSYTQRDWLHGYAIGAGVEYALTNNVRIGLDYVFMDFDATTGSGLTALGFAERYTLDAEVHALAFRLNLNLHEEHKPLK